MSALATLERRYRWARLNISFSGGRSSALMTKRLLDAMGGPRKNVVITFSNTAQEDERTLEFVHLCDQAWGLGVVWVEGVFDPRAGFGTGHRVVTYETAARRGEPFERMIQKYGLPGPGYLHCTRELKANPIKSYLRTIGWEAGSYDTAIGIRADEMDRQQPDAPQRRFVYPLIKLGVTKPDVEAEFAGSNVALDLPEELGNCTWCWKKSERKHLKLMREHPEVFDFPRRMEALHATAGGGDGRVRFLFRKHRTTDDLATLAGVPDAQLRANDPDFDVGSSCDETCELDAA